MKRILILMALAGPACAQPVQQCPKEFPLQSLKIAAPAGWQGVAPQRLLLTGADVVVGDSDNGALVGNRRKTRSGYEVEYSDISTGLPAGTGIWLACRYGDLGLAQRLPDNTERCVVSYKRDQFGGNDVAVKCSRR